MKFRSNFFWVVLIACIPVRYLLSSTLHAYKVALPLHIQVPGGITITNDAGTIGKYIRAQSFVIDRDAHGIYINHKYIKQSKVRFFSDSHPLRINGQEVDSVIVTAGIDYAMVCNYSEKKFTTIDLPFHIIDESCNRQVEAIKNEHNFNVRILLAQKEWGACLKLFADKGFVICSADNTHDKQICDTAELVIEYNKKTLFLNGKPYTNSQLYIIPKYGYIAFNDNTYQGAFIAHHDGTRLFLINCLDLEDYVFSVLRTESWPGWPLEVNKVFAVACRSYAIAKVFEAQRAKRPYHLVNTNAHQTYTGIHSSPIVKEAVEQTKNTFLAYNKKPILAMFDACCGGVIPAHIADFNFAHVPYLARSYACKHCKRSKLYAWQKVYESADLGQRLGIKRVRDVKITKKDKAGLVREIIFKGPAHNTKIPGKKVYAKVPGVVSFCFTAHKKSGKVIFKGRGYGHHLGLCQWGAREMVRDGWDYRRILEFYYPGTHFMKLS